MLSTCTALKDKTKKQLTLLKKIMTSNHEIMSVLSLHLILLPLIISKFYQLSW